MAFHATRSETWFDDTKVQAIQCPMPSILPVTGLYLYNFADFLTYPMAYGNFYKIET